MSVYRDFLLQEGVREDKIICIGPEDEANSKYRDAIKTRYDSNAY